MSETAATVPRPLPTLEGFAGEFLAILSRQLEEKD